MINVIHQGTSTITMRTTPFSVKLVIRWLIISVTIVVIAISIGAYYQSVAKKQQITSPSAETQASSQGSDLVPTPSSTILNGGTGTVFVPFVSKFGFNTQMRPYSADSYWNTPIANGTEYDSHSAEMIATIGLDGDGVIGTDPNQYTYPVYYADSNTPRWDIPCTKYNCTIVTADKTYTVAVLKDVPIPNLARPSAGTDGQMIIIDTKTFTEYDLWQVERTSGGWSVSNGSVYNIKWDGTPERYGSRGAGVPYLAGLIRPEEIIQGRIEHVLAFSYQQTANDRCVYPATKTDGDSNLAFAIPEGAHLQLDPSLTDADFTAMGLSHTGKIIAKALQVYGMTVIDTAGRAKVYVEDLEVNPYAQYSWSDPRLNLTSKTIAGIPYTYFRVLKLPDAYWNSAMVKPTYRDCYEYSNP